MRGDCYWYIVTSLLLKPLKQYLIDVTSFRLSKWLYSWSVPFKRTNDLGPVLPNRLDRRIYEITFPTDDSFFFSFFPFSVSHIILKSSSTLKTFLLFVTVALLSLYRLLFTAEVEKYKETLRHKVKKLPLGSSLLWDVTQRRLVVSYWRFETTYRSHLVASSSPATFGNYQFTLRNIPQERRSCLQRRGRPKSWIAVTTVLFQARSLYI